MTMLTHPELYDTAAFSWRAPGHLGASGARRTTGRRGEHGAHEQHGAVELGWLLPPQTDSALSCPPLRSSAISRGLARRPQARAAPAAPTRHVSPRPVGCDAAMPGLGGCRDRRGTFVSPRRSPLAACRLPVAGRRSSFFGTPARRATCALSLRVELTPRARPSVARRETTQRRGAWRAGLALGDLGLFGCLGRARAPSLIFFDTSTPASQPASRHGRNDADGAPQTRAHASARERNESARERTRMDQDGPEWTRMDQNGPEWTRMDQNGPEWT